MLPERIKVDRDDIKKFDMLMVRSDRTYDVAINFSEVSGIKGDSYRISYLKISYFLRGAYETIS